jgi:hypothetical protein
MAARSRRHGSRCGSRRLESLRRAKRAVLVKRFVPGLLVWLLVTGAASRCYAVAADATLSGTVRDVHGTPQMGAMIELLSPDATVISTAFSDNRGRYIMPTVLPGRYVLRATAAFFVPTLRSDLRLRAGTQSIVNLTLSGMFEAENWLPAQRRRADEPVDDWKWTLRSTAARPLLRLVDENGDPVSSSAEQPHRLVSEGRVMVTNGDGAFGDGGMHQALMLDRTMEDGDGAALRAEVGDPQGQFAPGPSMAVSAGYERRLPFGGSTRLVSTMESHPELTNGDSTSGFEVLQMASTQGIAMGDMILIDAGTLVEAERLEATRIEAEPFFRLSARPSPNLMVEYRYAAGRELQSSDDLDRLKPTLTAITDANGRPLSTRGSHQEIAISRKLDSGQVISASFYTDHFMDRETLQQTSVIADPTTGTFEVAANAYGGRGISVAMMEPLTPALSAWVEYDLGTALRNTGGICTLTSLGENVSPQLTPAASVAMRGKVLHTGTSLKAEYRWQRYSTLTQVNAYNVMPNEAYLSFFLRQRIWSGRFLPQGMDAVVEATNLLEQGYQPVLAPDGHTLFLAQVPRGIQGGLAFNF